MYTWLKNIVTGFMGRSLLALKFISTGLTTSSSLVRTRLYTAASTEIYINVVIGSKTFSLLTSTLNQVQSLKAQIEEKSGEPADCQLLRLNDKPLVMDSFHLSDYHVMENSTIYVQVHPWDEEYVYFTCLTV